MFKYFNVRQYIGGFSHSIFELSPSEAFILPPTRQDNFEASPSSRICFLSPIQDKITLKQLEKLKKKIKV